MDKVGESSGVGISVVVRVHIIWRDLKQLGGVLDSGGIANEVDIPGVVGIGLVFIFHPFWHTHGVHSKQCRMFA